MGLFKKHFGSPSNEPTIDYSNIVKEIAEILFIPAMECGSPDFLPELRYTEPDVYESIVLMEFESYIFALAILSFGLYGNDPPFEHVFKITDLQKPYDYISKKFLHNPLIVDKLTEFDNYSGPEKIDSYYLISLYYLRRNEMYNHYISTVGRIDMKNSPLFLGEMNFTEILDLIKFEIFPEEEQNPTDYEDSMELGLAFQSRICSLLDVSPYFRHPFEKHYQGFPVFELEYDKLNEYFPPESKDFVHTLIISIDRIKKEINR